MVDCAYSGKTGNKADALLCSLLKIGARLGLADKIYCCSGSASKLWDWPQTSPVKSKADDVAGDKGDVDGDQDAEGDLPSEDSTDSSSEGSSDHGHESEQADSAPAIDRDTKQKLLD